MSLRCVGNQLLQTAPSSLLAGASTASLSLWVRVNPGSNVANANGVEIFGDAGGKFSATLSGSGNLRLRWSSTSRGTAGGSSCGLALAPGTSYHLAAVWQDGSQRYFLNGVQVLADTQAGTIGVPGDGAPHPYRLGSDSPGVDVTLGDPTIWAGYALSHQDVMNLRDRVARPSEIAPSSTALQWPLSGPDGVAAKVGDAGLADGSKTGLNLSSVVGAAPTYQAANLAYAPTPAIGHAMVAGSGQSVVVKAEDASGNPSAMLAVATGNAKQQVVIAGTAVSGTVALTFGGHTTAAIPYTITPPQTNGYFHSIPVVAGKTYRVSGTWPFPSYTATSTGVHVEVIQADGTIAATADYSQGAAPVGIADGRYVDSYPAGGDTDPVAWQDYAPGLVATGASISVRISAISEGGLAFFADAVRVQDVTGGVPGTPAYYDDGDPAHYTSSCSDPSSVVTNTLNYESYNGTNHKYSGSVGGTGVTSAVTFDPTAATAAFQALPSVGAGNATISASGLVEFIGDLGTAAQPAITTTSPFATIATAATGAVVPTLDVVPAVGSPYSVQLLDPWIYQYPSTGRPSAWALQWLHQASPRQTLNTRMHDRIFNVGTFGVIATGYWSGQRADGSAVGHYLYETSASGDSIAFPFEGIRQGTYGLAVTWKPDPSLSTSAAFVVTDQSGAVLATVPVDQTAAPADYTDQGHGWKLLGSAFPAGRHNNKFTVTLASTGNKVQIDAVQLVPDAGNTPSIVLHPGDSATLRYPDGFFTCAAGAIPAGAIAIDNRSGGTTLPAFDPTGVTMPVAINGSALPYATGVIDFSNLVTRAEVLPDDQAVNTSDGYPAKLLGGRTAATFILVEPDQLTLGNGRGFKNCPSGRFALHWSGASDHALYEVGGGTISEVVGLRNITAAGGTRVYDITASPGAYSPSIWLHIDSTGPDPADPSGQTHLVDSSDVRVYPPDPSDPTGATQWMEPVPKFHPGFLYMLEGVQGFRWMNNNLINGNPYRDFSTIIPDTFMSKSSYGRTAVVPIARVEAGGPGRDAPQTCVVKVTFAAPHPFFDGCPVTFQDGNQQATFTASGPMGFGSFYNAICEGTTSTYTYVHIFNAVGQMTNVVTGGKLVAQIGQAWSMRDVIDLHKAVPSMKHCWFNTPATASIACVTAIGHALAAGLPAGCVWHHEFGNEVWNYQFPDWNWERIRTFQITGNDQGGNNLIGYCTDCDAAHVAGLAAFTAAGRAADYVATWGCDVDAGRAGDQARYASGHYAPSLYAPGQVLPMRYDEVCCAPYLNNAPVPDNRQNDNGTVEQFLDLLEEFVDDPGYPITIGVRDATRAYYPSAKSAIYECGVDGIAPFHSDGGLPANAAARVHAMHHHPRIFGILLAYFAALQAEGVSLLNFFTGYGSTYLPYAAFEWYDQKRGTGSVVTDAIAITNYDAMDTIPSEAGGAVYRWNLLLGSSGKTRSKQYDLGHNGMSKSTGISMHKS